MKKIYPYLFYFLFILLLYCGIFIAPDKVITAVNNALFIFATKLFPSIFPFFLLSFLLLNMGYTKYFTHLLGTFMQRVFHISGDGSFVLLMSIISGFPSGAKYIANLYEEGNLSKDESNYLLIFTHFANPLFVLGTCGSLLTSKALAYKIFFCQLLANLLLGILLRPKRRKEKGKEKKKELLNYPSFLTILPSAINKTMEVLLFMLGSITAFQFFKEVLLILLPMNDFFEVIFTGFLDLTSGISVAPTLPISLSLQAMLMLSFITFGSMSVHLQVINAIRHLDLSYSYFVLGRIIETAIALLLFFL